MKPTVALCYRLYTRSRHEQKSEVDVKSAALAWNRVHTSDGRQTGCLVLVPHPHIYCILDWIVSLFRIRHQNKLFSPKTATVVLHMDGLFSW